MEQAADSYRESIHIREDLLRDQVEDPRTHRNLMMAYGNYALLLGVPWSANLGHPPRSAYTRPGRCAMARESVAAEPQDATARFDLGMSLGRLGMIDPPKGGVRDSLAALQQAASLIEPIAKSNPKSSSNADSLAMVLE